jgi:hypothetical protein
MLSVAGHMQRDGLQPADAKGLAVFEEMAEPAR